MFKFLYFYGIRPGELMALRFSDINNNILTIHNNIEEHKNKKTGKRELTTPKTPDSNRSLFLDFFIKYNFKKIRKYYIYKFNDIDYDYFIFGGKIPLAPTTFRRKIKNISAKANLFYITPHEFRRSNASFLYRKHIPIDIISKLLGHANISTTVNYYIHSCKSQEKRVIKTLLFSRLF